MKDLSDENGNLCFTPEMKDVNVWNTLKIE